MFLFIVWTLNPLKRFLFIKASTNTIRFRNKPVIEKKRGKRIWNISNITDIFLSSCFWNHFQLTFYPYELLIHLPYKDALEGWWLFFSSPPMQNFLPPPSVHLSRLKNSYSFFPLMQSLHVSCSSNEKSVEHSRISTTSLINYYNI